MKKSSKKLQIAVLGWAGVEEYPKGSGPTKKELQLAEEIGFLLAKCGAITVTGGKSGIMERAARGAKKGKGITIGVITGPRNTSNSWTDVEVITGSKISGFDEVLIPLMSDVVIVIGGGAGTLQEISVCYRNKVPIILMKGTFGWAKELLDKTYLDDRQSTKILLASTPREAIKKVKVLTKSHRRSLS